MTDENDRKVVGRMSEEKNCRTCEHSGEWGNLIVCWLYSDEEIVVLSADDKACENYKEKESKCSEE